MLGRSYAAGYIGLVSAFNPLFPAAATKRCPEFPAEAIAL